MDRLNTLRGQIDTMEAPGPWAPFYRVLTVLPTGKGVGTLKAWMQAHDGQRVSTYQVKANGSTWGPGPRTVDASRAGSVSLDGSVRDYAGMLVMVSDSDTMVAYDKGMDTVVVYSTVTE